MKKQSFSATVKEHLEDLQIKKKCCRHAYNDGRCVSDADAPAKLIHKGMNGLVCGECLSHFLAGLFVSYGNVSNPEQGYHLEFSVPDPDTADAVGETLTAAGFTAGRGIRKNRYILYFKNSTQIEDFLGYIGASSGAFSLMNVKIMREMRGEANRQVNCDAANIAKSLSAAEKHIRIINELKESGGFNILAGDLKKTAELRVKFPDLSIAELGQKFTPPISKSGVKHRLDKIVSFYESSSSSHK